MTFQFRATHRDKQVFGRQLVRNWERTDWEREKTKANRTTGMKIKTCEVTLRDEILSQYFKRRIASFFPHQCIQIAFVVHICVETVRFQRHKLRGVDATTAELKATRKYFQLFYNQWRNRTNSEWQFLIPQKQEKWTEIKFGGLTLAEMRKQKNGWNIGRVFNIDAGQVMAEKAITMSELEAGQQLLNWRRGSNQ